MTVNEEREVFLRTISSYFKKNSNIPLEQKNIYSYLASHTTKDGYLQGIPCAEFLPAVNWLKNTI